MKAPALVGRWIVVLVATLVWVLAIPLVASAKALVDRVRPARARWSRPRATHAPLVVVLPRSVPKP